MDFLLFTENSELHSATRLQEEALKLGLKVKTINPYESSLLLPFKPRKLEIPTLIFHRTSGIKFDDFELAFSIDYEQKGAKIYNSIKSLSTLRDKLMQTVFLADNGVQTIPTMSFRGKPNNSTLAEIHDLFNTLPNSEFNSDQYILKTTRGNHGIGVNLINGIQSINSILETFWALGDQRFLIQPFLEGGEEYRVLIAADKVLGAISRSPTKDEFRQNAGRANAKYLPEKDIPKDVEAQAMKAFEASGCLYAGIDVLKWKDHVFILEINLVPGFKQMEELSGKNQAFEILNAAVTDFKKGI
jgi:RimK family alpha-L-glutamate ligase